MTSTVETTQLIPYLLDSQPSDRIALVHGETEWTYGELDARANRIARLLLARGAIPGRLVAVLLDRSPDMVAALLAVLKSGAGLVPIGTDESPERVRYVLEDSVPSLVVTSAGSGFGPYSLDGLRGVPGRPERFIRLGASEVEKELAALPGTRLDNDLRIRPPREDDTAYVGYDPEQHRPMGVVVDHRGLAAYLAFACERYPAMSGRVLLHSAAASDTAVTSIYPPLLAGGTIVLAGPDGPPRPPTLLKIAAADLATLPDACAPTETLIIGGGPLTGKEVDAWRRTHPDVTMVREYGQTEVSVGCAAYVIKPGQEVGAGPLPLGEPAEGTRLYVLDELLQQVPPGGTGELYVGGRQVAAGYLNRFLSTSEFFPPDPYGPPRARMYRTGDVVRVRPDGDIEPASPIVAKTPEPSTPSEELPDAALAERGELLRRLAADVLGLPSIGLDDDFIALGGNSIAAARLVARARKAAFDIDVMDVLNKRTIRVILTT